MSERELSWSQEGEFPSQVSSLLHGPMFTSLFSFFAVRFNSIQREIHCKFIEWFKILSMRSSLRKSINFFIDFHHAIRLRGEQERFHQSGRIYPMLYNIFSFFQLRLWTKFEDRISTLCIQKWRRRVKFICQYNEPMSKSLKPISLLQNNNLLNSIAKYKKCP